MSPSVFKGEKYVGNPNSSSSNHNGRLSKWWSALKTRLTLSSIPEEHDHEIHDLSKSESWEEGSVKSISKPVLSRKPIPSILYPGTLYEVGNLIFANGSNTVKVYRGSHQIQDTRISVILKWTCLTRKEQWVLINNVWVPREQHFNEILSKNPHPNILNMSEWIPDQETKHLDSSSKSFWMVMPDLCRDKEDGFRVCDLFDFVEEHPGGIPSGFTLSLYSQILDGMLHLHETLLISHRDIKDENVLVLISDQNDLKAVLIDFGSACSISSQVNSASADTEKPPSYFGTVDYAPPEILQVSQNHNRIRNQHNKMKFNKSDPIKQDIWALGVLLYVMTYGEVPFRTADECLAYKEVHAEAMFPSQDEIRTRQGSNDAFVEGSFRVPFESPFLPLIRCILRVDPTTRPTVAEIKTTLQSILNNFNRK